MVDRDSLGLPMVILGLSLAAGCSPDSTSDPAPVTPIDQTWVRDVANPAVSGNGTIVHMSDPSVIYDGGMYRMWFGSVGTDPTFASVGYAESSDGITWSNPVVVFSPNSAGAWDEQTVEIPSVLRDDAETDSAKRYKMWYGGSNSAAPDLTKIGYAYSADGLSWTRLPALQSPQGEAGLVVVASNTLPGDNGVVAEPTVIQKDGSFHMWYSSFSQSGLVISYATSPDGIVWTKHAGNPVLQPVPGTWEDRATAIAPDGTVSQPCVVWDSAEGQFKMWYGSFDGRGMLTYTGIGYATSPDGFTWTKLAANPVLDPDFTSPGEQTGIAPAPSVLQNGGTWHMWIGGFDASLQMAINHMTLALP